MLTQQPDYIGAIDRLRTLDNCINQLRDNDTYYRNKNFVFPLLVRPLTNWSKFSKVRSLIFAKSPLVLGAVSFLPFVRSTGCPIWLGWALAYILMILVELRRMTTLGDASFHIEAYKLLKRKEFELFSPYLQIATFTYFGLHSYMNDVLATKVVRPEDTHSLLEHVTEESRKLLTDTVELLESRHREEIETIKRETKELLDTYDSAIELAKEERNKYTSVIRCYLTLLERTILVLDRIHGQDGVDRDALALLGGFSLYEVMERKLVRIGYRDAMCPEEIQFDEEQYVELQVIGTDQTAWRKQSNGQIVFAKTLHMEDGAKCIYSFHFFESEVMMMDLTINAKIDNTHVYRLLTVLCNQYRKVQSNQRGAAV